ncbi:hypothetical protein BASA81_017581 [Batrachochytrium salamandrivorans]|nr:hypothetical protein BASA81_017581 [Batrachochytrium salamandrivorans]
MPRVPAGSVSFWKTRSNSDQTNSKCSTPLERWGIDFVQDLPTTKSGNQHIVTAIDYATRWVVARAVPSRDSVTVANFIYELMMNYGSPFELFSDRGSSFISEGIREYEKLQHIRHHATTPYHPQTNGMVERMHATMGHAITTLTQGRPDRWDESTTNSVCTSSQEARRHKEVALLSLVWGRAKTPGDDNPIPEMMAPLDEIERMEERAEHTARNFDDLGMERAAAYHRSVAQAKAMRLRNKWDPESTDYYFKIGDWVKLKHHSKTKFEFDWKGPYHVVDVGHPAVQSPKLTLNTIKVHHAYGLQSDEDSQLASILERLQLLEAENASLKQSISQAQSQAQSQPQEATQHIAPPLPQYRQSHPIPARQVQREPAEAAHLPQPAGAGVSYHSKPIQFRGIKVATAGTLLTTWLRRGSNPILEKHPRQNAPQLLPAFKALLTRTFSATDVTVQAAADIQRLTKEWPREYLLFTVPAN